MRRVARVLVQCASPPAGRLRRVVSALEDAGIEVEVLDPPVDTTLHPRSGEFDAVLMDPVDAPAPTAPPASLGDVDLGRLRIRTEKRLVEVDGVPLPLSAREYALLHYLASYPGVVFTRDALLQAVWGSTWRTEGSVTEYIRRLRVHLREHGIAECLVTRPGFGYTLEADALAAKGARTRARRGRAPRRR